MVVVFQPLIVMLSFCQVTAGSGESWVVIGDSIVSHRESIWKKAFLIIK